MGREAKRVPLDFEWPQGKTWAGYLMPDRLAGAHCPACNNGYTDAAQWVRAIAYCIAGLADDADDEARGRQMHPYLTPLRDVSYNGARGRPGVEFAEFADGIAPAVRADIMGRDVYRTYDALLSAAGLPEDWGTCRVCDGHGTVEVYPGQRADADAWEPTDPPTGDGWQLWETTSGEGSPSSPVFAAPDELARWCVTGETVFGYRRGTYEQWLAIVMGEDFAHVEIAPGVIVM